MAGHENCVPASIGFGKTALISALIECHGRQVCVLERSHPGTTCGISFAGTWFPFEESTTVTGSGMDHRTRDSPSQPVRSGEDAVSCQTAETLHTGLGKNWGGGGGQRMFVHWNRNIRDIMRSHISRWIMETVKEAYTQADREFDWVTVHEVRALSSSWVYNCQVALPDILSAAFLEVIWGLPEFVSTGHGLYRWWRVYSGSSGVAQQVVDPGRLHPPP